ncbi:MAG: substrate-binding domain-containing protein, partial [Deltaproteobacteria bacterium]|nr:substrate-binding domain-containing protein [Deltaproteobacteria bacterium]
ALLRALAQEFRRSWPSVEIEVPDSVGSNGGIRALMSGQCELARVARPLTDNELFNDLRCQVFALTPVVFVVHRNVRGLASLSQDLLLRVYSGRLRDWSEIGAEKSRVYVANREKGDSSRDVLERELPAFARIDKFAGRILYNTLETVAVVNQFSGTIAYLPLSAAAPAERIRILEYEGIKVGEETVLAGEYPFVIPLGLVWQGEPSTLVAGFLCFLRGPTAAALMRANGAFPLPADSVNLQKLPLRQPLRD